MAKSLLGQWGIGAKGLSIVRCQLQLCTITLSDVSTDYGANGITISGFDGTYGGSTSVVGFVATCWESSTHVVRPLLVMYDITNRTIRAYLTGTLAGASEVVADTDIVDGDILTGFLVCDQTA